MPLKNKKRQSNLGILGEDIAFKFLKTKGYKVIDRNYHDKTGEIDIIAIINKTLVFIEVKTRTSNKFGNPVEAVTPRKLKHIEKTGMLYAQKYNLTGMKMAIEVISIEKNKDKYFVNVYKQ